MTPIRIGFIGLSTSGWAAGAHVPYLKQTSKYKIVGICNSTKASGENAIKHYELPPETKAYGSAQELADDPDVDLVVVSVRTDKHGPAVRPALEKGKNAYVEWPLGRNVQEARELADLARKNGSKTIVGLQARRSPVLAKIKELLAKDSIGRILSSTVLSSAGNFGASVNEALEYFNDPEVGGNIGTIHFGHLIDFVLAAVGPLASYSGIVSTQRPMSEVKDSQGKILRTVPRKTPDHLVLQGVLRNGAVLSVTQRGGDPFKDTPGLLWRIYGERGEIQVELDGSFLNVGYPNMTIKVHDHEKNTAEVVEWSEFAHHLDLPQPGRNVAGLYESFAEGKTDEYVEWEEAVTRHELLHGLSESSKNGARIIV